MFKIDPQISKEATKKLNKLGHLTKQKILYPFQNLYFDPNKHIFGKCKLNGHYYEGMLDKDT